MGQELRIKNYELRRGVILLLLTSYFLLLVVVAAPQAFAVDPLVPTDCYEQGDYSLGSFLDIAQNVMKFVWSISGAFALLMFFFGGILWLVSAGEDKRVTQGRDTMVQAATGLIIVLGSWVFVNFVVAALTGSPANTTATIFHGKAWSTYDDGPCLTSYWQRAFPLLSSHAPSCSGAPLSNITPYASCDLACKARGHTRGSMVGGVCCCTGTATATPLAVAPAPPAQAAAGSTIHCCIKIETQEVSVMCNNAPDFSVGSPVDSKVFGWEHLAIPAAECTTKALPQYVASCNNTGRQNVWRMTRLSPSDRVSCDNKDCPQINTGTGAVTGGCQTVSASPPQPSPGGGATVVP